MTQSGSRSPNIRLAHPHSLFAQAEKTLNEVGPHKFFSSPEENVKKAREGFAAYFFSLALKEMTKLDWWVAQYDQAAREYPDFDFISFGNTVESINIEKLELTGVYPHFKEFAEMLNVVNKKLRRYGSDPLDFSLLVFVNHEKSEDWIKQLQATLQSHLPFKAIWTIHLLFTKGGQNIKKVVANRIGPKPFLRVEADMDNKEIHKMQPIPTFLEEKKVNGITEVSFKAGAIDRLKFKKGSLKAK